MAEVDAHVFYWTQHGMRSNTGVSSRATGYIEVAEVERLLEEAHARGRQRGAAEGLAAANTFAFAKGR